MEIKLVDLSRQYRSIKQEVDQAVARALDRADFILGAEVESFEQEFASYCEAACAVGLDSGASALELGLRALGIGAGDEVIVPANTFFASAAAVASVGATPVFADVDPATYTIGVQQIAGHITGRTKAIMPVHLYGQPAEMDQIMELATRRGLLVIEDACQAHGARYKGRRVGSFGHAAAFSFYPGKNLGAYGDGGALVTNDAAIAEAVRVLRNCGQREKYHHVVLGGNHRLDTLQAAVLRVKLARLDEWNEARRTWAKVYDRLLESAEIVRPLAWPTAEHVFHLYVVEVENRERLQAFLAQRGIATGVHYPIPLHLQPAFAYLGYKPGDFPVAEYSATCVLSLPLFPELLFEEVEFVTSCVLSFLAQRDAATQPAQVRALGA
jgi:dTDP-4-amino-4,6-dideoxygalactose transaminase